MKDVYIFCGMCLVLYMMDFWTFLLPAGADSSGEPQWVSPPAESTAAGETLSVRHTWGQDQPSIKHPAPGARHAPRPRSQYP